jgi:acylphosphatase
VLISGYVQGVGFRYATYHQARRHGVLGWVRNRPDGRVEALFEGEEAAVRRMVEWCRRGPEGASVDAVDVAWQAPVGQYVEFRIEPTQ